MGSSRRDRSFDDDFTDSVEEPWDSTNDTHTLTARERIRRQLASDVEAFLAQGGQIQHLDTTAHAENYAEKVGDNDLF
ncbi:hypothetical protein FHR99_002704 [Litorivivens lipolytica]|uniref:Transcriptional regulator SutA RNAP-binding domain-containing protein n=1 Tax=Litorivivens lipolytica TaxID=1524264 RepID=A0A7W4W6Q1_9GAMM|nr:hypothetical protein [Litorivivens lipolytica]MBB3048430.1 hypothetical protein [Litorivivens lipolytica]